MNAQKPVNHVTRFIVHYLGGYMLMGQHAKRAGRKGFIWET